jgi:hypothetical protein
MSRRSSQRCRHVLQDREQRHRLEIADIAGEQLAATIAGQRDGGVPARHLGHEIGGDLRGVREGLVEHLGEVRDDAARMLRLVVTLFMEANGEAAPGPLPGPER